MQKAKEEEEKRLQREQAEREAAEARERERLRTYRPHASAKKQPTMSHLDYTAVFGARPKIARTPDHIVNRSAYYQ
ncbi:hypothetical protein NECAME_09644 [Necator americanus]|uniref:Uncharacterized protein n=1 Tax=Necator americanus TaxID=51031 RepID=W2TFK3_NECAM|nr:hypothetical protein NECAME_09644 [Necator americanus]ETN79777.1 hypothetical protein NECAME_09644 [Necator americanus]